MIRDLRTTNIIEIIDLNPETNYIFLDGLNIGTIEHFLKGDYYIV